MQYGDFFLKGKDKRNESKRKMITIKKGALDRKESISHSAQELG